MRLNNYARAWECVALNHAAYIRFRVTMDVRQQRRFITLNVVLSFVHQFPLGISDVFLIQREVIM